LTADRGAKKLIGGICEKLLSFSKRKKKKRTKVPSKNHRGFSILSKKKQPQQQHNSLTETKLFFLIIQTKTSSRIHSKSKLILKIQAK